MFLSRKTCINATSFFVATRSPLSLMPLIDPPDHVKCPITRSLFVDPVVASDTFTYERAAIENWLLEQKKDRSPMTNAVLPHKRLQPVHVVKKLVSDWKEEAKICTDAQFLKAVKKGNMMVLQ